MTLKGNGRNAIGGSLKRALLACSLATLATLATGAMNASAQQTIKRYVLVNNVLMPFDAQLLPVHPPSTSAVAQDPYKAVINWSASINVTKYRVEQLDLISGVWNLVYQGDGLTFTAQSLAVGEVSFRISSCRDDSCSSPTPAVNVTIEEPLDTDYDGVFDYVDACPLTSFTQSVDANGCAVSQIDSDNDGVVDLLDLCPNSAPGAAVGAAGCVPTTADNDNDGVTNDLDRCDGTAASTTPDSAGCAPEQKDSDIDGLFDF